MDMNNEHAVPLGSVGEALDLAIAEASVSAAVLPTPPAAETEQDAAIQEAAEQMEETSQEAEMAPETGEKASQKKEKKGLVFVPGKHKALGELFVRSEFRVGDLKVEASEEDSSQLRGQVLRNIEIVKVSGATFAEIHYRPQGQEEQKKVAELILLSWTSKEAVEKWEPFYGLPKKVSKDIMTTFSYKKVKDLPAEYHLTKEDYKAIRQYVTDMITHVKKWRDQNKGNTYNFLEVPVIVYWAKSAYAALDWKQQMVNRELDGFIIEKDRGQAEAKVYQVNGKDPIGSISITTTRFHGYRSNWSTNMEDFMSIDMQELAARVVRDALEDN